ncbi:MAG: branched-chain amino acid ABC transporter ATP-binding protein/permease [Actinobacteria bacterium]|nr:branched-chain amino acid ABC transporter ATP-binding protein/permease [Actinomycetota bacterium]
MKPRTVAVAAGFVLVVAFPWLPFVEPSQVINANLAGEYAIVAISLVILTGWVGQISLAHGAFVGIGAFTTGILARNFGIPFPANLPIVMVVSAGVAALLGVIALRVRGLYLAVATLIFAWMADAWLFTSTWLVGSGGASSIQNKVIGREAAIPSFDFSNKRTFYLVVLATLIATVSIARNLRESKTGRAFFAVRGSEMAAVSLGIDLTRYKLLAFALSGGLAGVAGNLLMTDLRTATPVAFQFTVSLFYLSIVVVGGLTSVGGAIAASVLFAGLNEVFFRVTALNGWLDFVTVGLLLLVLLVYPGGLGALGAAARDQIGRLSGGVSERVRAWRTSRRTPGDVGDEGDSTQATSGAPELAEIEVEPLAEEPGDGLGVFSRFRTLIQDRRVRQPERRVLELPDLETLGTSGIPEPEPLDWREISIDHFKLPKSRAAREPVLNAEHITVQFGGLTAVDDVSLEVREHEIVGLIGPNGAGKTTMFNAIAGLNEPTSGRVQIFGTDATELPVHRRAQMGVGRTFQLIQLFPQLTVFENLLVATHGHNPTGVLRHLLMTPAAVDEERASRLLVHKVIELVGLEEISDQSVTGLPFGLLRQVELARALVTQSPLLMLDEPASGLDNAETDEFAHLLRFLRAETGVTILLIEHDVRMVTSISDYIYVINRGQLLAEGQPASIQRNPTVVAAYLGQSLDSQPKAALAHA